jgi:hypothetical protein
MNITGQNFNILKEIKNKHKDTKKRIIAGIAKSLCFPTIEDIKKEILTIKIKIGHSLLKFTQEVKIL